MQVVSDADWVKDGKYEPNAYLKMTVEQIAQKCGFEPMMWDEKGQGKVMGQKLKDSLGRQYILKQYLTPSDENLCNHTSVEIHVTDATQTARSKAQIENSLVDAFRDLRISLENVFSLHASLDENRVSTRLGFGLPEKIERFGLKLR